MCNIGKTNDTISTWLVIYILMMGGGVAAIYRNKKKEEGLVIQ